MRPLLAAVAAVLLLFAVSGMKSAAQTTAPEQKTPPVSYDASQEVTLNGTVSAVFGTAPSGLLAGSHVMLTTLSGPVDVSLGAFGLMGKGAVSVMPGQQIQITGVMRAFHGNPVFLARTVKSGDSVYAIRNEHGIPVTPLARQRASQSLQPGEKQ